MRDNEKMKQLLGMSSGKAHYNLRQKILFWLAQITNKGVCFQCQGKIEDVKDMSIEHKQPWLHTRTPKELYFSYANIAFSHIWCNRPNRTNVHRNETPLASDDIKKNQLGMLHTTARHKLVKLLIFEMARESNLTNCYKCSECITNLDDCTIEHKESWINADDPIESYFSLENIAFSHHTCNISSRKNHYHAKGRIKYKGVTYRKRSENDSRPYCTSIGLQGKKIHLGYILIIQ